ncbi:hypothetical protein BGP77_09665 [Saccharospirillum sp. MSK14-1]|uniref:hypothetical protein n=1 Tax=Saccharospirillum sp. MSK14-1 TaxID=1897632 RepID=UPI000D34F494|nr:hypothetical protein [Saccharospirillum sp. MSK14-1]PTY39009.1 hypothetical protein BGP77_09665 [Saccharospirillum sp. MSK14-1]
MAIIKRARSGSHNWLYLTPNGFGFAQLRASKGALPQLSAQPWHAEDDPLNRAEELADRVAEHAKGTLNLLLGEGYYQLLLVDVPEVPADEMEAALRLKAAELLHYDLDEASLEVILLPAQAYHGRTRMAFIVATHQQPLRQWALALAKRGLTLTEIDIDQLQLRNLALRATNHQQNGLLHLRPDHCQLLLIYHGELVLTRRFDIGYEDLGAEADGDALILEGQTDIQRDSLVLELRRSFDYYESQLGLGSIHQLNLTGWPGTSGMIDDLGAKLGLRFMPLRLEDYVQVLNEALPESSLPLAGTAFRGVES